jgi:hypothetical protein
VATAWNLSLNHLGKDHLSRSKSGFLFSICSQILHLLQIQLTVRIYPLAGIGFELGFFYCY